MAHLDLNGRPALTSEGARGASGIVAEDASKAEGSSPSSQRGQQTAANSDHTLLPDLKSQMGDLNMVERFCYLLCREAHHGNLLNVATYLAAGVNQNAGMRESVKGGETLRDGVAPLFVAIQLLTREDFSRESVSLFVLLLAGGADISAQVDLAAAVQNDPRLRALWHKLSTLATHPPFDKLTPPDWLVGMLKLTPELSENDMYLLLACGCDVRSWDDEALVHERALLVGALLFQGADPNALILGPNAVPVLSPLRLAFSFTGLSADQPSLVVQMLLAARARVDVELSGKDGSVWRLDRVVLAEKDDLMYEFLKGIDKIGAEYDVAYEHVYGRANSRPPSCRRRRVTIRWALGSLRRRTRRRWMRMLGRPF
jgi:hypothetical protein